ncbi:MAG: glycosyltransferase [Candidatus Lokiarchaeota archaeon]|nr:glycosyltransferase [Candidatus Harpocratesius repetitus]
MNILILQETDWELRGPHQQHHLFERLSTQGHNIHVIDYEFLWQTSIHYSIFTRKNIFEANPKIIPNSKITIIRPSMIKLPLLSFLSIPFFHTFTIYQEIKKFRPDLIFGFGILNSFIALLFAKIYRIPFCYYLIDHLHTLLPISIFQPIAKFFETYNIKKCDYLFAINKGLLDYADEMIKNKKEGILIPGGVDIAKYSKSNIRLTKRSQLNIEDDEIVLMFMGWLYDFSGLREISDYYLQNEMKLTKIKLLIVGKGDLYEYLVKIKMKLKYPDNIILTNQVPFDKIPEYLQAADFCILPAHKNKIMNNIVPIKLYEYMAAGKLIIATKLDGIFKEYGDNNGIIYINRPEEVFTIIQNPIKFYDECFQNGQKFIKNYDWDRVLLDFKREMLKIVSKKSKIFSFK